MNPSVGRAVAVTRATVASVRSERVSFVAASLAYYAFVSLVPLLLLGLAAASVFGGDRFAADLTEAATRAFGAEAGSLVRESLANQAFAGSATAISLAVLLWSGLKLFRGMDVAFSSVYGSHPGSFVEQLTDGVVTLLAVALAIVATVAIGAIIAFFEVPPLYGVLGTLISITGLTLAFLPLYYVLPDVEMALWEALPGALFAACGWTVLQTGFRVYATRSGGTDAYGVLGAALLLITWLYFGGLILLVGVVLNGVLQGRVDDRGPAVDFERTTPTMTDPDRDGADGDVGRRDDGATQGEPADRIPPGGGPAGGTAGTEDRADPGSMDEADLREELRRLREEVDAFEERVEDRTVHREQIEDDLRRYVRQRVRRGKARGWGPYLVLLYGTAMTLGAFFYLSGGWAILAMLVVWLSTLGLYALMVVVGATVELLGLPGRLADRLRGLRG